MVHGKQRAIIARCFVSGARRMETLQLIRRGAHPELGHLVMTPMRLCM
jgi:hypothetical protein